MLKIIFFFLLFNLSVLTPILAKETGSLTVIPITQQDQDVRAASQQKSHHQGYDYDDEDDDDYGHHDDDHHSSDVANSHEIYDFKAFKNLIISLKPNNRETVLAAQPQQLTITLTNTGFDKSFYLAAQGTVITFANKSNKTTTFQAYNEHRDKSLHWAAIPRGGTKTWTVNANGGWQLFVDTLQKAESHLHLVTGTQTAIANSNETVQFKHLPEGDYQLSGWHQVLPAEQKTIHIHANQTHKVKLHFSPDAR